MCRFLRVFRCAFLYAGLRRVYNHAGLYQDQHRKEYKRRDGKKHKGYYFVYRFFQFVVQEGKQGRQNAVQYHKQKTIRKVHKQQYRKNHYKANRRKGYSETPRQVSFCFLRKHVLTSEKQIFFGGEGDRSQAISPSVGMKYVSKACSLIIYSLSLGESACSFPRDEKIPSSKPEIVFG